MADIEEEIVHEGGKKETEPIEENRQQQNSGGGHSTTDEPPNKETNEAGTGINGPREIDQNPPFSSQSVANKQVQANKQEQSTRYIRRIILSPIYTPHFNYNDTPFFLALALVTFLSFATRLYMLGEPQHIA